MEEKKISVGNEVIRFAISGLVCAIFDFLVSELFLTLLASSNDIIKGIISTTAGFIVGVIMNYILSTFWVFKGVENKKETKSIWFIIKFVILSAIALALSYGTYELCHTCFLSWWNLNIYNQGIGEILTFSFWGNNLVAKFGNGRILVIRISVCIKDSSRFSLELLHKKIHSL